MRIFRQRPRASSGYWLVLQLEGNTRYLRAKRAAVDEPQDPGDLLLIDPGYPFEAVSFTPVRLLVWDLPADCLRPLLAAPEAGLRRIPRGGVSAILGSFAQSLMREADRLDAIAQRNLKMHLCGLMALALGATAVGRQSRRETCRAVRRQQVLAYIEAHLRDYRLTVDRAATDLRMSRRWLHAVFDDCGTTFAAWVAWRRVEECMKCLEDPAFDRFSITEIAFHHGFNDLSTFNRRFRSHFGMTPPDARRYRLQRVV
ncbi:MAG TPA: helix-turn-helix domain-containing protein [Vicinamibacterales bacterium]